MRTPKRAPEPKPTPTHLGLNFPLNFDAPPSLLPDGDLDGNYNI